MTNPSSGYKRSWDGADAGSSKRAKSRDEPRDWRDVHLNPPKRGKLDYGKSRADRPHHQRDRHEGKRDEARASPKTESRSTPTLRQEDSEKEEGEISPVQPPSVKPETPPVKPPTTEPEPELDLQEEEPSVEQTLAARRAKRQAILAKYSANSSTPSTPGPTSAVEPPSATDLSQLQSLQNEIPAPANDKRASMSASPTPANFSLARNQVDDDVQASIQAQNGGEEQISAADYDPSLDRREDERKRVNGPIPNDVNNPTVVEELEEEDEEDEDDLDDMFALSSEKKVKKKAKKVAKPAAAPALITTNLDSAADSEGYYSLILGEQLDGGRYQVVSSLGKGMFATVVRARVLQNDAGDANQEVAIKIVRCQESMARAGQKEALILNKLKQADPEDKKHIIRLERTFEHRGHLCLVFESMSMNLRDVVKRFGKDVGINIRAVRAYAHQLFLALSLLRKLNIMHADIKPDNILVNEQKTLLKLCDLGSASDASENDITPYLVSRFYRAPEIILGVPYDPAIDVWSVGCTLFELYTGKILFPGRSNNHMLLLMMELKGRFNTKMIKRAQFGSVYFDEMGGFESIEKDRVTGADVFKKVHISKPTRDLRARLMPPSSVKVKDEEMRLLTSFIDLLDKCLALDPARRLTPREALSHPFIRG